MPRNPSIRPVDADASTSDQKETFVQSFARGLDVVRSFDALHPAQTLSEVAAATQMSRASARRILLTLQALGYVAADGRLFRLTPKILSLGFAYLTSLPFWNVAGPVMEDLVKITHESTSAAVLDGTEIVYVARVPTHKIMAINLSVGSRLPAFCTSMGRVLLSGLCDDELDDIIAASPIQAYTSRTLTAPADLHKAIAVVRKQGWAVVDQELEAGLISLSAPIRNRQGKIIAAINISGSAQRKSSRQMVKAFLDPLLDAAERISGMVAL